MEKRAASKLVKTKKEHRCIGLGCEKILPKGSQMYAEKYYPRGGNKDPYFGLVSPRTFYVCLECKNS